jgi:FtsH-binding integral membrane protein
MNAQFPPSQLPSQVGLRPPAALSAAFLTHAFTWMFAGLLLTAAVAAVVQGSPQALQFAADWMLLVIVAQLGLVLVIGGAINRISATAALGLFFVYAATLGLTVGLIVSFYTLPSVAAAFFSSAAMFGGAALYGATTKRSLASVGGYLTIGVIGLVVAMVVNIFLSSGPLGFVISIGGVILFTILTAYNVQRISAGDLAAHYGSMEKAAVIGALQIYLNFINIFLFMLRILGERR